MRTLPRFIVLWLLACASAEAYTDLGNHIYQTDGSAADTQAAVNAALDGYIIKIPAGTFSWPAGLTVTGKGVKIQGAGAGSLEGESSTSLAVSAGLKTFITQPGLGFQAGQTVRAIYTANGTTFMQGTVTSYSGSNLQVSVTTTAGSGTLAFWALAIADSTSIIHNAGSVSLFDLTEAPGQSIEVSGIHFVSGNGDGNFLDVRNLPAGKSTLIHDCRFSPGGAMLRGVQVESNRGIVYKCSFDAGFFSGNGNGNGSDQEGIAFKWEGGSVSWNTIASLGMDDATGLNNFYVEDCYFAGMYLQCMDFDDNSRTVVRHCRFNNSGIASHGQETSAFGLRHFELYNNDFIFSDVGSATYNINWCLYLRGGTGCIFSNSMPALNSQAWGQKPDLNLTVQSIRRSTGIGCITNYPAPRQVGQGFNGSSYFTDPVYIWDNTGTGDYNNPARTDYNPDECGNGQLVANYIQPNRDFFLAARPGYRPYLYPHPLRRTGSKAANLPPVAMAAAVPLQAQVAQTISLSSAGSYDPEGVALTYFWIFGDGSTSINSNPTHAYPTAGNYVIRLNVSDGVSTTSTNLSINVLSN